MGLGGFSWKRATGISAAKSKISRSIGIPLTKSGRQRKIGKFAEDMGGGFLAGMPAKKGGQVADDDSNYADYSGTYEYEEDLPEWFLKYPFYVVFILAVIRNGFSWFTLAEMVIFYGAFLLVACGVVWKYRKQSNTDLGAYPKACRAGGIVMSIGAVWWLYMFYA